MAATKRQKDLATRLHASGIRSRTAELIAAGTDGRRKPAKQVRAILAEVHKILGEVDDRRRGGPAKRSAAAKKAAATRKRNAAKRSATAKKGARTKAKAKANG